MTTQAAVGAAKPESVAGVRDDMQRAHGVVTPARGDAPAVADRARRGGEHFVRNYVAFALDGGFFGGALAFVNATALLPLVVTSLHGPTWLVSLTPVLMGLGFIGPPVFLAHWTDGLRRYMPLLMVSGIFQRLPYLLAGIALIWGADQMPRMALAAVALSPLISGIFGGVGVTAWQQLVVQCIPQNRRSSVFAFRAAMAAVIGILAGYVIQLTLQRHPGAVGYGILHLWAFGVLMASYFSFAAVRETPATHRPARLPGLIDNLKAMPSLVCGNRQFVYYLLFRNLRVGIFILAPFLALHCTSVLRCPESYVGRLAIVQMLGAIVGNLVAGYLGDRVGTKITIYLGMVPFVALTAGAAWATNSWAFEAIFFLFGLAMASSDVGTLALGLDICPVQNRSTYLAIISLLGLPSMLAASWISKLLWRPEGSFAPICIATVACLIMSLGFLLAVRDPRRAANRRDAAEAARG